MSATHRVHVKTSSDVHHWSWALNGGTETHMPAGSLYVDITAETGVNLGVQLEETTGIVLDFSGSVVGPNPHPMPFVATERSGTNLANGTSTMITNSGNGSLSWVINESGDLTIDMITTPGYSYGNFVVTWPNWYQNYLDGTTSTNSVYWGPNTVFTSAYSNQTVRMIVP